jgi:hypothetical protein
MSGSVPFGPCAKVDFCSPSFPRSVPKLRDDRLAGKERKDPIGEFGSPDERPPLPFDSEASERGGCTRVLQLRPVTRSCARGSATRARRKARAPQHIPRFIPFLAPARVLGQLSIAAPPFHLVSFFAWFASKFPGIRWAWIEESWDAGRGVVPGTVSTRPLPGPELASKWWALTNWTLLLFFS